MENQAVSPALEMHTVMDNLEDNTKRIPPMQKPRARLLLSCGESILAMARKAYQRVETMPCPVGCVARGVSRAAAPVLSPLRRRCFSALTFVDRQLLVVQDVATVLFPATERVLGKADDLVLLVESLPVRLDGAIDGLEALVADVKSGAAGLFVLPKRRHRYRADEEEDDCCGGCGDVFRDIRCDEEGASLHRAMKETQKNSDDVARKRKSLEDVTADDGDTVHGEKALINTKCDSKGEATPAKRGDASDGQECAAEDVQRVETPTPNAQITEGTHGSTEIAKAEAQEGESRQREEEAAVAMAGTESRDDALLGLFDTAWQQKLA